jgi:pimeloyl-ACP methyl ester carboxylesterase
MDQGLHYEVDGTGAPVLLIHGTGSSLRVWDPVVYLLAARRTVIAVDLPGFGFSPPMKSGPPPTPAGYAHVLADLLGELGYDSAHVAGNSVGGWTALEVAKLGVARSVVALAPAGLWARRAPLYAGLSVSVTRLWCRLLDPLLPALLSRPLGRKLMMWQQFAHPERVPARAAVEAAKAFAYSPGFDGHLIATSRERFVGGRSLAVPVTVAFGGRDRLLLRHQSRHRKELPPQTRWLELPDCGHVPTYDAPSLVAEVLLDGSAIAERPATSPRGVPSNTSLVIMRTGHSPSSVEEAFSETRIQPPAD